MQEWCGEQKIMDGPVERPGKALISSPTKETWTVIYDEALEQEPSRFDALAYRLSTGALSEVVVVRVYDADALAYTVYDDTGRIVDEYVSHPDYLQHGAIAVLKDSEKREWDLTENYGEPSYGEPSYEDDPAWEDALEDDVNASYLQEGIRSPRLIPDVSLLEELAASPMADREMFYELLDPSQGTALGEELLEEFSTLLGIDEKHHGLQFRDWVQFTDQLEDEGFLLIG
jgi:hypothetical protein